MLLNTSSSGAWYLKVESDDTKFVVRAEKIKSETKAKHRLRMCRFLGRTLPMFALAAVWPLAMVTYSSPSLD